MPHMILADRFMLLLPRKHIVRPHNADVNGPTTNLSYVSHTDCPFASFARPIASAPQSSCTRSRDAWVPSSAAGAPHRLREPGGCTTSTCAPDPAALAAGAAAERAPPALQATHPPTDPNDLASCASARRCLVGEGFCCTDADAVAHISSALGDGAMGMLTQHAKVSSRLLCGCWASGGWPRRVMQDTAVGAAANFSTAMPELLKWVLNLAAIAKLVGHGVPWVHPSPHAVLLRP